eukprot:TRINITY_DN5440_c1_g1_i1.p2 TRINITY_DN5440_c1_g1~~TRINITY_DN5440_c1_g1_i1.p2  ORF type:complete len:109 (-),score=10.42 TRINITY_DN5440_c1_g1_i1:39-365(-)
MHWQAGKRILRYLKGTKDTQLVLKGTSMETINVYTDASQGTAEGRSITGYLIFIGDALVAWGSKKQNVIALSTDEVELIAMVRGIQQGLFVKNLLEYLSKMQNYVYIV